MFGPWEIQIVGINLIVGILLPVHETILVEYPRMYLLIFGFSSSRISKHPTITHQNNQVNDYFLAFVLKSKARKSSLETYSYHVHPVWNFFSFFFFKCNGDNDWSTSKDDESKGCNGKVPVHNRRVEWNIFQQQMLKMFYIPPKYIHVLSYFIQGCKLSKASVSIIMVKSSSEGSR